MKKLSLFICLLLAPLAFGQNQVSVGSKKFTESYILAEVAKKVLEDAGFKVDHREGMGGTIILWTALKGGKIDFYPEYTGTITEEILKSGPMDLDAMSAALRSQGVGVSKELGFRDNYGLAMREQKAQELGITKISDLAQHPDLICGISSEYLGRKSDGWGPLTARYGLTMKDVRGMDHGLAYDALKNGQIDLTDVYTTDAEIGDYKLRVLEDDLGFLPKYSALFLYRLDAPSKAVDAINSLAGTIDEREMIKLNGIAKHSKEYTKAAQQYFKDAQRSVSKVESEALSGKILRWTGEHLRLVGISLLFAVLIGIPLGVVASRAGFLGGLILSTTGLIQTIPSLALLALLIPFFGIDPTTAILALFLYSLLPIVRNTATGIQDIPIPLRESAAAIGLPPRARLMQVYLPMASRSILAGIKTSAVINVGTATLAALIGAGGLGTPIISGLNLNDKVTILQGAVPAAILALIVQFLFDGLDRVLIPRGLRLGTHR